MVIYGAIEQAELLQSMIRSYGVVLQSYEDIFGEDKDLTLDDVSAAANDAELLKQNTMSLVEQPGMGGSLAGLLQRYSSYTYQAYARMQTVNSADAVRKQIDNLFETLMSTEELPEAEPS